MADETSQDRQSRLPLPALGVEYKFLAVEDDTPADST